MTRRAFVLGSNGPEALGRLPRLQFAESDATHFADAICAPHVGFDPVTVTQRDPRTVIELFSELAAELTPADDLLFYFSGHGVVTHGDLFLVLDGTEQRNLNGTALPYVNVRNIVKGTDASNKLIILDCCHAGEAVDDQLGVRYRGGFDTEVIRNAARGSSASVLVACGPDGAARESASLKGGIMTSFIVEALRARPPQAADPTGRVSLESLRDWMWKRFASSTEAGIARGDKPLLFGSGGATFYLTLAAAEPRPTEVPEARGYDKRRMQILAQKDDIRQRFGLEPRMQPAQLQRLAAPLKDYARRLESFGVIDELLAQEPDPVARDAGVFSAAVILHERMPEGYFDRLVEILSETGLRGAATWRVLRAIRRYLGDTELTAAQKAALIAGLRSCASAHDEPAGQRFQSGGLLRLVYDIAKHHRLKPDCKLDDIFSKSQLLDLKGKRDKSARKARDKERAPTTFDDLAKLTSDILNQRTEETNALLKSYSSTTSMPSGSGSSSWSPSKGKKK